MLEDRRRRQGALAKFIGRALGLAWRVLRAFLIAGAAIGPAPPPPQPPPPPPIEDREESGAVKTRK